MGNKCSQMYSRNRMKKVPELRIGLLGLDNAGKSTVLLQLKFDRYLEPTPTMGLNVETLNFGKLLLSIWEVGGGGQEKARMLWQHYNQNTRAIIFVVDATDLKRLPEVMQSFNWLCWQPELIDAVFLIYANKQDLPGALPATQLAELFELTTLLPQKKWVVQSCCAQTGDGLEEGLEKLLELSESTTWNNKICSLQ